VPQNITNNVGSQHRYQERITNMASAFLDETHV